MPVFHFILHAYGTWHPDHERGYHQHAVARPFRQNVPLGTYRRRRQSWPSASFPPLLQSSLLAMTLDICHRRSWRCHAVATDLTHLHIVCSWFDGLSARQRQTIFKRILAWHAASLHLDQSTRLWFSAGGNPKPVANREHLHYLLRTYLPDQGGLFWQEGDPIPPLA